MVRFRGEFEIRPLDSSIYWASFLAKPAVDALCHIYIVTSGPTEINCNICICFDSYCQCWADSLTRLTCNTTLLPSVTITAQGMLPAKFNTYAAFFEWVVNSYFFVEHI